ncbi:hypothetical protein APY03_4058 [Variovorax sp. WDL1]|nr:hypothetical protein APY03_4058 [Variovorax sp. WDL1]
MPAAQVAQKFVEQVAMAWPVVKMVVGIDNWLTRLQRLFAPQGQPAGPGRPAHSAPAPSG